MSSDKVETHRFQAEVSQVLNLVVHSLYSNKDVFLRELVSNASDALDRLKFKAITEPGLLADGTDLEIRIDADEEAGTVTITDNGLGMTHDELIKSLGTIAHSGTKKFLEAIQQGGQKPDVNFIGQFGVGFYSAYLVANRVEVTTRAAGSTDGWRWTSDAQDEFTVTAEESLPRGTSVVLHLKDETKEYADRWRLKELVTKYSDFVSYPILLPKERDEKDEGAKEFEAVNQASALWQRPKGEIDDDQYKTFYKHLTREEDAPLAWTHFRVEGSQEFTGLIYIPSKPPFDFDNPGERRRGVRLFVKRVFIMDDCEALVPEWLRFVRGVIDSDDLPLNVSREILQDSSIVRAIRKQLVKKTLDLLDELAKDRADDYKAFWTSYGRVLKEALHREWEHRDRVAKLVRFESSHGDGLTSLADYVSRMKEAQEAIYYVLADSRRAAAESPHLEVLRKREYEVLYLTDVIDQWAAEGLREFDGKKLVSAQKAELKVPEDEEKKTEREAQKGALKGLFERALSVLGDKVRDVRASDRLTDSPVCLVVPDGGINPSLERILKAHGREVPQVKRILEVNPSHPLIEALRALADKDPSSERVRDSIEMLYEQALLTEGTSIEDPQRFARRLTALMEQSLRA